MTRRTFWIIFSLAVLLRIFWINVPALWYDENYTMLVARLPFDRMMQAVVGDVHPPLWYLIEWSLFHIAPNLPAWAIRLPALVFSILSLPMYIIVMRKLGIPSKVKTAAFVIMAFMPFQLWYAQEGRMYAMLEFFVLLTLSAALGRSYLFLFIGSLALLYTQNYGPFYLVSIALVIFIREKRDNLNWCISAMASAGLFWLPWFQVMLGQMNEINGQYWIMDKSIGGLLVIVYKLFFAAAVPAEWFVYSYIVTFAACIIGMTTFIASRNPGRLTIALMAFVPVLIAWLISLVWQPVVLSRPLIGISPFVYIIAAWSFEDATTTKNRPDRLQTIHPGIARQAE